MVYSLFLNPSSSSPSRSHSSKIKDFLVGIELIEYPDHGGTFSPGDRLMEYINFLGCSPTLQSGETECQIRIHEFQVISGLGGEAVESLRFPRCRHIIPDPTNLVQNSCPQTSWTCSECGNSGSISDINWRKSAGFARLFIEISSIFPKEAVPNEKFLGLLSQYNHADWTWFYSKSTF